MQDDYTTPRQSSKKKVWILTGITLVVFAIIGILIAKEQINQPENLGQQLEYIGKEKVGCAPGPISFICIDSNPFYTYYFATDLDDEALKEYFTNATYFESPSPATGTGAHWDTRALLYKLPNTEEIMHITTYDNTGEVIKYKNLKQTNKLRIISLVDSHYELAKKSL